MYRTQPISEITDPTHDPSPIGEGRAYGVPMRQVVWTRYLYCIYAIS